MTLIVAVLIISLFNTVNDKQTKIGNIVVAYHELLTIDDQISRFLVSLKEKTNQMFNISEYKIYQVVGSVFEGCFSSSFFFNDSRKNNVLNKEIDLDVEFKILHYPIQYKHCLHSSEKLGLVEIQAEGSDCSCPRCYTQIGINTNKYKVDKTDIDGYLLPYKLKELFIFKHELVEVSAAFQAILCVLLDDHKLDLRFANKQNITKATYYQSHDVSIDGSHLFTMSFDVAMMIQLDWETDIIGKWKERKRVWPPLEKLNSVLKTTYLIGKTSHFEKNNKHTREFRYSFGHMERKIISLQSLNQRLVYYIAKSIFNKWIKPIDSNLLPSFILKNTFLWICEIYEPESQFWGSYYEPNKTLAAVTLLYKKLSYWLKERDLPYYFIPDVNIIRNVPKSTIQLALNIVQKITVDVYFHIPKNTNSVLEILRNGRKYLFELIDLIELCDKLGSFGLMTNRNSASQCIEKNSIGAKTTFRWLFPEGTSQKTLKM